MKIEEAIQFATQPELFGLREFKAWNEDAYNMINESRTAGKRDALDGGIISDSHKHVDTLAQDLVLLTQDTL